MADRISKNLQAELVKFTRRHVSGEFYGCSRGEVTRRTINALLKRGLIEGRRIPGGAQFYITDKGLAVVEQSAR